MPTRWMPTPQQIAANPDWIDNMVAVMFERILFDEMETKQGYLNQAVLEQIACEGVRCYSGELTLAQTEEDVPGAWPDSAILDEEGEVVRQKMWYEYFPRYEVQGDMYVLRCSSRPMGANGDVSDCDLTTLNACNNKFGSLITQSGYDAIKVEPPTP